MRAKLFILSNRTNRANPSIPKSQRTQGLLNLDGIPNEEHPDEVRHDEAHAGKGQWSCRSRPPMVLPKDVGKGAFGGATSGGGARGFLWYPLPKEMALSEEDCLKE